MKKNINNIDISFKNLIDYIKGKSLEEITNDIKHNFYYYRNTKPAKFKSIIDFYNKHKLWGEINLDENNFELIEQNAKTLINNIDDFIWVYEKLEDYRSKKIFVNVLYYWIMLDEKKISALQDSFYSQYFDLDIINCDKNEIFVDVGSYTGDTMIEYIKIFGKNSYKRIYCYEIVPANIEYIKKNIEMFKFKNIVIKEKGATDKPDKLFIKNNECSSITQLTDTGEIEIKTVRIDDDIKGKITFIKMDIEGGEFSALKGLENKIKKYKPKLAISVYHNNNHLWEIPKFIHNINPDYKFYFRYYGGPILPTEYILYAI